MRKYYEKMVQKNVKNVKRCVKKVLIKIGV